ncbi:MAG TPA: hypothetical protein PLE10_07760 [Brevefilum sp.]|nr:hypothetical protein [Brevefilum sp.]HOR19701.1 hypothetical protein [Brevefilum sp.]HPL69528.1 hypothetical protein [Brevefilum sp.]
MEPNNPQDEFYPIQTINHLLNNWWKIVLWAGIFGILGLAFSYLKPPKYEAEAIFSSTIDYSQINFANLVGERGQPLEMTQYDLDLALSSVQRIIYQVRNNALAYAQSLDPNLEAGTFGKNMAVERLHDRWYLRFRHEDPQIAQSVVNYWAEITMSQLEQEQADNKIEPFVLSSLIAQASLPNRPLYQNRNTLVLAGTIIGLCLGILLVDMRYRFFTSAKQG